MTNTYCVYMHKNKINGKVYIGQTCQKPEYRWGSEGKGYVHCTHFYRAIQKYGWNNFEHIILNSGLSLEEANLQESYWINYYDSTNEEKGYNIQRGGLNRAVSQDARAKLSEHSKERWANEEYHGHMSQVMKDKWQTQEYIAKQIESRAQRNWSISEDGRRRISEARKAYIAEHGTPTQGVGHTEQAKQKIRESKMGEKNPMYGKTTSEYQKQRTKECCSKKIRCIETGEVFESRKDAATWAGLKTTSGIIDYLSGRKKSAGKHPVTGEKLHWENVN